MKTNRSMIRFRRELERLVAQENMVVNIAMEVIECEQKSILPETGVGSVEGGAAAFVGDADEDSNGCSAGAEGADCGL